MDVTAVFRLKITDEQATLVMQSCTHNVPYGEHFRVEDTLRLKAIPGGGVAYDKWTKGVWVKPLPWALSPVTSFVEKKIIREAKGSATLLGRILQEAGLRSIPSTGL